jgi:hypothetical protein
MANPSSSSPLALSYTRAPDAPSFFDSEGDAAVGSRAGPLVAGLSSRTLRCGDQVSWALCGRSAIRLAPVCTPGGLHPATQVLLFLPALGVLEPWVSRSSLPLKIPDGAKSCAGSTLFYYQYVSNPLATSSAASGDMLKYSAAADTWVTGNEAG